MTVEESFERFARDSAAGFILGLRKMGGNTKEEAMRYFDECAEERSES